MLYCKVDGRPPACDIPAFWVKRITAMHTLRRFALFGCIALLLAGRFAGAAETPPRLRVLIFSGQNNHDWRKTTPALKQILDGSGRFTVEVTEHPEQCTAATFAPFDCILSNWNNFGVRSGGVKEWPAQTRNDLLEFVRTGHGFVVVHSGGAMFRDWPEFQKLIGGTWVEGTGHGAIHAFEVKFADSSHPITKGLAPFTTTDELWHRMATRPEKKILATAFSAKNHGGSGQDEPVAMITEFGRGRCFNLVLGHNAQAMASSGFQTLLVRGVQWAATGKVAANGRVGQDRAASAGSPLVSKGIAEYKFGDSRASLLAAERLTLGATDEATRKTLAAEYAAMLAGPATADGKRFLCRQLGLIGTAAEVPALEGLLADEQFAFAARSALERIPGDEALAALRRAAEKAKGRAKAGLIQSLGVRRDQMAVPLLAAAVKDADHVVASAALVSLGRIGGKEVLDIHLTEGDELAADLLPQACEAALVIARDLQGQGPTESAHALEILEFLQSAYGTTGVRGAAVLARLELLGEKGTGLLINALAGKDPVLQSAAIRALHLDPKEGVLKALAAKFADLPPAAQLRVVQAMADIRQAAALPIILRAAASKDPAVRQAALAALGSVGNAASVPVLLDALQSDDKDVAKQLEAGLARLPGPGVDAALVAGLEQSPATTQRKIIRVLAARGAKSAVPALLKSAESPDAGVRGEAIRALGAVADAKAGLQAIELLDRTPDRAAVEVALTSIYRNAATVDPLLQALQQAGGPRKASLVAVLGSLGGTKACAAVRAALKTGDADTRRAAVRALAAWPDAAPLDDLLAEAAATQDATNRVLALRGVANLAPAAVDRTPDDRVAVLRKAIALADGSEQIKPILSALGKIPCRAAAQLAAGYLKDPAVRDEAALAIVQIAEALGPQARGQIGGELTQARAACDNPVIKVRLDAIPSGEK
jgi:type 1 glutamine amidotransferase